MKRLFLISILMTIYFNACDSVKQDDISISSYETSETKIENEIITEPKESLNVSNGKIVMPNSTDYYIGSKYTIETLTEHFAQLGFTNIETVPCKPDDEDYKDNIFEMTIKTGWFSDETWQKGREYNSDAKITIYYNETPLLTVENCSDLDIILTSKDMDHMSFAQKYDGRYVEFDAYVTSHITYDGGTSHIIDVTGGDYDGKSELGHYSDEFYKGLIIRAGDRTSGNDFDNGVEAGENVTVSGRIDASWCEYYKQLYVECVSLTKR